MSGTLPTARRFPISKSLLLMTLKVAEPDSNNDLGSVKLGRSHSRDALRATDDATMQRCRVWVLESWVHVESRLAKDRSSRGWNLQDTPDLVLSGDGDAWPVATTLPSLAVSVLSLPASRQAPNIAQNGKGDKQKQEALQILLLATLSKTSQRFEFSSRLSLCDTRIQSACHGLGTSGCPSSLFFCHFWTSTQLALFACRVQIHPLSLRRTSNNVFNLLKGSIDKVSRLCESHVPSDPDP